MTLSYFQPEEEKNKFFNSQSLAILVSLALHSLLLLVVLPNLATLSGKNDHPEDIRDVKLIELNPVEQSRLPTLNPATIPELPSNSNIPPISSSRNDLSSLPPLADINSPPSLSTLPSLPPLPSLPSLPALPSVGVYSPPVASLPSSRGNSNTPPYSYGLPKLPSPPPNPSNLPNSPTNKLYPNGANNNSNQPRPDFDPFRDNLTLNDLRNAPRNASEQRKQQLEEAPPQQVANNPRVANPDMDAARRQQLIDEMLKRNRSLQADQNNTTDEEARRNYVSWLNQVKEASPTPISLVGTYPGDACSRQLAGTAIYGVKVSAQGLVEGDPQLIKSAGYPILNQQAFREVRLARFPTGVAKSYRVSMSFAPTQDVCRSTTIVQPNNNDAPKYNTRVNPPAVTPPVELPTQRKPTAPTTPAVKPQPSPAVTPAAVPSPDGNVVIPPRRIPNRRI
ncbi:MAG: hypothetical protein N5P05_000912 [Chroococcopsis gigantea SAG 12.99]|nr:hypothetical protein [Chroococcopsis gigantea SAG 12.99]